MTEARAFCWTCWNPPAGPGTPWDGTMIVPDTLRLICVVLAVISTAMIIAAVVLSRSFPQRMRFVCMVLFTVVTASIEIEHFGDTANWRLGLVFLAVLWQTLSIGAFLRDRE